MASKREETTENLCPEDKNLLKLKFPEETKWNGDILSSSNIDPSSFCRTCATVSDCLIPIFKGEGMDHQLHVKIEKYLPIKVFEMDSLPVQLCYQCASTLIAWDILIVGCEEAEKKLKQILTNAQSTAEVKVDTETLMDLEDVGAPLSDVDIDSDDEPLIAKTKQFKSNPKPRAQKKRKVLQETPYVEKNLDVNDRKGKQIPKVRRNENDTKLNAEPDVFSSNGSDDILPFKRKREYSSENCSKSENISDNATDTSKTDEPDCSVDEKSAEKSKNEEFDFSKIECGMCSKLFCSKLRFKKHIMRCTQTVLVKKSKTYDYSQSSVCPFCGLQMKTYKGMHKHVADVHENTQRVRDKVCEMCGFKTHRNSSLDKHLKRHLKVNNHFCSICGKGFMYPQAKMDHEARHTDKRPFKCDQCTKDFLDSYTLKKHKREQHGGSVPECLLFSCNTCWAKFRSLKSLKMHISWKHDPTFNRIFRKRDKTQKVNDKTYDCPTCFKSFRSKWNFTAHVRIHTGERPYSCEFCDRKFVRNEGRLNHQKKCPASVEIMCT